MRKSFYTSLLLLLFHQVAAQDYYEKAKKSFDNNQYDSARYFINKNLTKKPNSEDYFLSALIHEMQGADLRAAADYEAVVKDDSKKIEAYFQKGLIYYENGNSSQAIIDFTHVIENFDRSETNAVYFGYDPNGDKGTFLTTLQSMKGKVYQYRAMAYQQTEKWSLALKDFEWSLEYDSSAELFINRSQLYTKMGYDNKAVEDLRRAVAMDPTSYLAWYNLALLDESARLPEELLNDDEFAPMLNLMGANAYESKAFDLSINYYGKALESDPKDDLALIGRGKALLRTKDFQQARDDFIKALQVDPERIEALYLIGNSFFYEQAYPEALGFYEQYLSVDPSYANVWYNAAMSYLSTDESVKACSYLKRAESLGMAQAVTMMEKHCGDQ